ncbi:MAG: DUF4058 family protein [Gemmataceae bacterium]|nr:DUF4058 family protein [Gemmataceae bacterium]
MPLLDHFHPPLYPGRHWASFHAAWATEMMAHLNRNVLPQGYLAESQIHVGSRVEVDVATLEQGSPRSLEGNGDAGGVAVETWAPPTITAVMPAVFPDEIAVQVFEMSGGMTLVAAIELVSPANKDRPESRRAFAAKCAACLQQGIGLVIVDVVTERQANLHDELVSLMQLEEALQFPTETRLYAAAYRPARREPGGDQIDLWQLPLVLGQSLPTVPLALRRGPTLPLDLEATYTEARRRSRL